MQKTRSEFPEIDEIRQDIDSLKSNVVELSRHLKAEGTVQARKLGEVARERFDDLRRAAHDEYAKAEKQVKAKPGQSVAIAFAAGLALSFLLSRGK